MKVTVYLNRADILRLNLYLFHKSPSNLSLVLFIWLGMTGVYFYRKGLSQGFEKIIEVLLNNAIVSLVLGIALISFTVALTIILSTKKAGVLGRHDYELKEDGLLEITEANETLTKWNGVESILKTKRFMLIQVNWYLFHALPARCFSSMQEFEEFYKIASERVNTSGRALKKCPK